MMATTGNRLGKYELRGELGRGGTGIVYRGFDTALRRPVAIKVLPQQLTYDTEFVQRFQQEAILAASLHRPNIVTIHDVGEQAGINYIIMEYLEGTTPENQLAQHGPLTPDQTSRILSQVAAALDYAHAHGVIHRDVKPANIMLGADGRVTLMDFGLVRAAEGTHLTRSGTIMGTPEAGFWYPPSEPPDFACAQAQALGRPRRGFSRVWCENSTVRQRIGNALNDEAGLDRPVQEFENGFMIYVKERGTVITAFRDDRWSEQR